METMTKKGNGTKTSVPQPVPNPLAFTSVKVFSATKQLDRNALGEMVTDWIRAHPGVEIVDKIVTQSSDSEFHCLTITLFYK
jgi:hypothetical protein